ncbi:NosL [Phycisphaerae bacterium RAS1]|nr:NosL [Phycisphaerae bacterium RAS1]
MTRSSQWRMPESKDAALHLGLPCAGATLFNSLLATRYSLLTASLLALVAACGCGRGDDLSPPAIAYGQTECDYCKMIVSDEPFAAAACISADDGVWKIAFDDVGCLLDYLKENSGRPPGAMYVHDFKTGKWLSADEAVYVRSEKLHTPMASNLAAFETRAAAEALRLHYPGQVLTFDALRKPASGMAATSRSSP